MYCLSCNPVPMPYWYTLCYYKFIFHYGLQIMLAAGNAQKREIMCNDNLKTHNVKEAKPSNTKKSPKRQK